ncbi:MAG: hypothetical protein AB1916_16335 [Thermodesulfobacteriota bacterium]
MKMDIGSSGRRVALIGSTNTRSIGLYLRDNLPGQAQVSLFVKSGREHDFGSSGVEVVGLGRKHITPYNVGLLRRLRSIAPDEIVILCGPLFFHGNVLSTIAGWRRFLPADCVISYWIEGKGTMPAPLFPSKHFSLGFHVVLAAVCLGFLAAALSIDGGWMWAGAFLALAVVVELMLRSHAQVDFLRKRRHNILQFSSKISGFDIYDYDEELGFKHKAKASGAVTFELPEHRMSYSFSYRMDESGRRVSSPAEEAGDEPRIVIIGASTAFGYGVSDRETFSWLLGEAFPEFRMENHSVAACHLYQQLLILERRMKERPPRAVVLGLSVGLDSRVTNILDGIVSLQLPYPAAVSKKRRLRRFPPELYKNIAFSEGVSLLLTLEYALNRLRFRGRTGPLLVERTMEHILLMMRKACENHGVPFLIAVMGNCRNLYPMLVRNRFNWCIANKDGQGYFFENIPKWHLFPFDNHPNQAGHAHMATVIAGALRALLDGRFVVPDVEDIGPLGAQAEVQEVFIYPLF